MKGLRNILVHQYGKIEDSIVFQILKDHLDDIDGFTNMIGSFLDNNETCSLHFFQPVSFHLLHLEIICTNRCTSCQNGQ